MFEMKLKNAALQAIEARRYSKNVQRLGRIRIDHNSSVVLFSPVSATEATVGFEYTATYGALGMIKFEGTLVYEGKDARKIAHTWEQTKKLPDELASRIHTYIMHMCVPEAVGIAKGLHLPPPIPLPQVKFGQQGKTVESGPEFG
jgi:hypothetical protein